MRSNKITCGLVIASIVVQWYVMRGSGLFGIGLPFATGLQIADMIGGDVLLVMCSIIPIPFILWMFSGDMSSITQGYGKLYVIRNYSKTRMVLKTICRMVFYVIGFECFAAVIFKLMSEESWVEPKGIDNIKIMLLYCLGVIATVLFMYCLEFFVEPPIAHIIALVGFTGSLFGFNLLEEYPFILRLLLFPNLAFATRNGIIEHGVPEGIYISLIGLSAICFVFVVICVKSLKTKDIM